MAAAVASGTFLRRGTERYTSAIRPEICIVDVKSEGGCCARVERNCLKLRGENGGNRCEIPILLRPTTGPIATALADSRAFPLSAARPPLELRLIMYSALTPPLPLSISSLPLFLFSARIGSQHFPSPFSLHPLTFPTDQRTGLAAVPSLPLPAAVRIGACTLLSITHRVSSTTRIQRHAEQTAAESSSAPTGSHRGQSLLIQRL